jgi:hypothetical protein
MKEINSFVEEERGAKKCGFRNGIKNCFRVIKTK